MITLSEPACVLRRAFEARAWRGRVDEHEHRSVRVETDFFRPV